jgi:hypothetical protein
MRIIETIFEFNGKKLVLLALAHGMTFYVCAFIGGALAMATFEMGGPVSPWAHFWVGLANILIHPLGQMNWLMFAGTEIWAGMINSFFWAVCVYAGWNLFRRIRRSEMKC